MKGSSNDAVSAGVPCGISSFALGKTMLDPLRVSSHRVPSTTDNNVCPRAVEPQRCARFVMNLRSVDM